MGMRGLTLFAAAHAVGTALLLLALPHLVAEARTGDTGAALLLVSGAATVLAGARTAISVLLAHLWRLSSAVGLAAAPLRAASLRLAPRAARSALTAAVGGTLTVAALTGPTFAASPSPAWPLSPAPAGDSSPLDANAPHAGTTDPAWPLSEASSPDSPPDPDDDSGVHVVASGESLWQIVAAELPSASAAEIAARVEDVHASNRPLIGDDANLILPGQRLVLP